MSKIQYESIVRNLMVAYKVSRQKNKQPAVVLVYADSPGLPMAQKISSHQWSEFTRTVRQDQVVLHVRSYQEILTLAQEAIRQSRGEQPVWKDLEEWVNKKISGNSAGRKKTKKKKLHPLQPDVDQRNR